jgi:outer membrane protein TolC
MPKPALPGRTHHDHDATSTVSGYAADVMRRIHKPAMCGVRTRARGLLGGAVAVMAGLSGCIEYQPQPLDPNEINASLTPPDSETLNIDAAQLHHPILKPLDFDLADGLSPDEAAVFAVLANPALRAARDRRLVADAQLLQAGILPNPQLTASLDQPFAGSTEGTVTGWGLGVEYDIGALITRKAEIAAARAEADSVALDIAWQEWQAAEAAKLHTVRLIWLQQQLEVTKAAAAESQDRVEKLKSDVENGLITRVELQAAQTQQREFQIVALEALQAVDEERLALNEAIGLPPTAAPAIQNGPGAVTIPTNEVDGDLESHRLDLLALRMGYQSQEEKLRAAVLSQFPKITVAVNAARDTSNVISIGPAITIEIPLFDRGEGRIAVEKATRQQLYDEYASRLFEARADVAKLRSQLGTAALAIRAAEEYVASLETLEHTFRAAVQNGASDILNLYEVQNTLARAKLDSIKHRQEQAELVIGLEVATGQIAARATP